MLKKFLVTLMILTCMTCAGCQQTENTESNVKHISNKTELAHYIESQRKAGQTVIPVVLTNGLTISTNEVINGLCPSSLVSWEIIESYSDKQNLYVIFTLMDYPGTNVANAYLSKDKSTACSKLTDDEKQLYSVAESIVDEAKKIEDMLNQEFYIYNEIMRRATYLTGDMSNQPRFVTAIGALVDGKANCQGYSDAFYMLGRMLGWNVGRMGGGEHQWNTITLDNGKTYCVDVTWGDTELESNNRKTKLFSYVYLNAPIEIMQVKHSWDRSIEPANLQPSVDDNYAYCAFDNDFARVNNAEGGLKLLAQKIGKEKFKCFSVMTPYDERYATFELAKSYFSKEINSTGYNDNWWLTIEPLGKYLFITADTYDS